MKYPETLHLFNNDNNLRFCNAQLINPLGSQGAAVWQPQRTHRQSSRLCTHNERPETMDQKYGRIPILGGWNWSARRKPTKAGMESKTKFIYNHWLAALVNGKCLSTKPTGFTTGVVYHPDTEQNRPYKISWPCLFWQFKVTHHEKQTNYGHSFRTG